VTRRARLLAGAFAVVAAIAATATGSAALAGDDSFDSQVRVQLSGYQEDPLTISTAGSGTFRAEVNAKNQTITYRLSYSLEGSVTQSHIHFGGRAQSGGVAVFLCSNLGNGPAGTQACPAAPATITGVITPADVIGPAGQGIAAGEFAELIAALRAGKTYVNVHSTTWPGGEIRAQLP
jgi:CHRD domain